jgi:hypothetical protein
MSGMVVLRVWPGPPGVGTRLLMTMVPDTSKTIFCACAGRIGRGAIGAVHPVERTLQRLAQRAARTGVGAAGVGVVLVGQDGDVEIGGRGATGQLP